jgi:hypothetical protein
LLNELTIEVILTSADTHHGFDAVSFSLGKLTGNAPCGFFQFGQHQIDLLVSRLYEFEILLKIPFFL